MTAPQNREAILQRFQELLDRALTSEQPPQGIDAEILSMAGAENSFETAEVERRADSYALWEAMTALSQEVKLEGRAFKELNETLESQAARIGDELRELYREREREVQRETERRCRREALGALIDLRDRLGRGLKSARESYTVVAATPGWYERLGRSLGLLDSSRTTPPDTIAALIRGYELGVERLDQTLADFNAREIICEGRPFDPRLMNAIDTEESASAPEGSVIEVYRSGYEWNGEVFRTAQVKVSRAPADQ